MEPWLSWAIVIGLSAVCYWYYKPARRATETRSRSNTGLDGDLTPRSTKRTERAKRSASSASSTNVSRNVTPVMSAVEDVAAPVTHRKTKPPVSEDDNDSEWAEQMAKTRKGTNLAVPSRDSRRAKTVKTSSIKNASSDLSSTSGADADDDLTPAASPALKAGDVSDMLESKQAGPSVLRLTEPSDSLPVRAPRPQKEFVVAETKKQRQNRRKNEERKLANEEVEKERKVLQENQRRTAREARGEPAKNGLQPSKGPATNAWADKAPSVPAEGATPVEPLLDNFDRAAPPAVGNAQASVMPNNVTNGVNGHHEYTNGMTEEEQITLASRNSIDEDGWNTVASKKGKKQNDAPRQTVSKPPTSTGAKVANGFASLQQDN